MTNTSNLLFEHGKKESLPYIPSCRQFQRLRYDEQTVSLVSFTDYSDPPLLSTVDLLADRHTLHQNGGFERPSVRAPFQQTVVILGRQFNQYLQAETSTPKGVDGQEEKL